MDEMQKIQYAANSYYNRGLEMAKERNLLAFFSYHSSI